MSYNRAIHHRHSQRLKNFDYASGGAYFVTICTCHRACVFGQVEAGSMRLSNAGECIRRVWNEIPANDQNVEVDEFVVMPNHIHGIIVINDAAAGAQSIAPKTVGEIVRAFKARCTRAINQGSDSTAIAVWQRNYYEHIIRNERDLADIREYIVNNPLQWDLDENNPNRDTVGA